MAPSSRSKSSGKAAKKAPSSKSKGSSKKAGAGKTAAKPTATTGSRSDKPKSPKKAGKAARPAAQAVSGKRPVSGAKAPAKRPVVKKPAEPPPPPTVVRPLVTLTLATRRSALAVRQAELAITRFEAALSDHAFKMLKLATTGDHMEDWRLEEAGGQGLFTSEIEASLLDRRADIAVHSAKDMPTGETEGLEIAGYLPRDDPRDVLLIREGLARPQTIATGSPRRRAQLQRQFAKADFLDIRGNVETRLAKIADGYADATVLAAAGLNRLDIAEWPGVRFQTLPLAVCVPAAGQGAIAVQARPETAAALRPLLDIPAARAVEFERAVLRLLGGGCHTSFAVHYDDAAVHVFHESCGYQRFAILPNEAVDPARTAASLVDKLNLNG